MADKVSDRHREQSAELDAAILECGPGLVRAAIAPNLASRVLGRLAARARRLDARRRLETPLPADPIRFPDDPLRPLGPPVPVPEPPPADPLAVFGAHTLPAAVLADPLLRRVYKALVDGAEWSEVPRVTSIPRSTIRGRLARVKAALSGDYRVMTGPRNQKPEGP